MSYEQESTWEAVIGLEVHVELNTKSKLFSSAPNRFGDEPNSNISVVCTGQPGALPVLNREAVRKAVQFGCAVGATINHHSSFDRKSYFYPDSPRNFQITQFYEPIVTGGSVTVELNGEERTFEIEHAHLEDDAGMLKHFSSFAGVDYNRAGVPLIEIVSQPCMHTPQEASAYGMAIKGIMQYLNASDCNMEEGSLRMDANVSVRKKGEKGLRTKCEIKNMNSFSYMELALQSEIRRQIREYERNADKDPSTVIHQSTYRWDPAKKETVLMRRKEVADDYRYFPEPDLVPIVLDDAYIEEIRSALPEMPLQRTRRYISELGLAPDSAFILTTDKPIADYFEEALKHTTHARNLCNWMIVEFAGRLKESGRSLVETGIAPLEMATLVNLIAEGTITGKIAKKVADDLLNSPTTSVKEIIAANPDYQPLNAVDEIEEMVDQVLEAHPQSIEDFKAGKDKAFAFLVGQVMKLSRGKASPQIVNDLLKKKIDV